VQFGGDEVVLADELSVVDDVQLFAGGQLFVADAADEALEMVNGLAGSTHQVVGQDALTTAAALGAETSAVTYRQQHTGQSYLADFAAGAAF